MTPDFDINNYIFLSIVFLVVYLPIRAIFLVAKRKTQKVNPLREVAVFVLWAYAYFMTYRLVCPYFEVDFYGNITILFAEENSFVPFDRIFDGIGTMIAGSFTEGLGVILRPVIIFLPVGFLAGLCYDVFYKKVWLTAIVSCVFGIVLQVTQIFTLRGFIIDDAILYALGGAIGIFLLRLVEKFAHNRPKFQTVKK